MSIMCACLSIVVLLQSRKQQTTGLRSRGTLLAVRTHDAAQRRCKDHLFIARTVPSCYPCKPILRTVKHNGRCHTLLCILPRITACSQALPHSPGNPGDFTQHRPRILHTCLASANRRASDRGHAGSLL